ncbi:hypothetical protein, partial [Bacteroides heparinolyticus]|uniref:hypothetical protein n=1 Tax=Prevotella heparinolytica TaxID=28113 RepID=UPI0035A1C692
RSSETNSGTKIMEIGSNTKKNLYFLSFCQIPLRFCPIFLLEPFDFSLKSFFCRSLFRHAVKNIKD